MIDLAPGSDFSTYLGNEERTSSSSSEQLINLTTAPLLHVLWSYKGGNQIQSQPVEQSGIVYFGGRTGYEYAVYATNGTLLWKTFLGQAMNDTGCGKGVLGVTSTATVVGNDLYVDGGYPYLYALNSSTGAIEWRAPIGGTSAQGYYDWSSPLIYDNNAYVGIASQCDLPLVQAGLDEFSLTTHALVGYFDSSVPAQNGSSIWGSPSVNPATNTIFVATGNAYKKTSTTYSESIVALNATTLAVQAKWQVPASQRLVDSDFGVTPTLFTPSSGYPMVTAPDKNGILYAFYQSNLTLAWEQPICCKNSSQDEHISTAWGGGYVYAVSSSTTIGGVTYNSSVREFNPLTGAIVWQEGFSQTSYNGYAAPLWVNQLLVVPDQGTLLVLNATTGAVLYQNTVGATLVAAASISRGEIFAGSSNDRVYAFDLMLNSSADQSRSAGTGPLSDSFGISAWGGLPPYSYAWAFGDGATSILQNPSHTFTKVGTYHVTAVVTDLADNVSRNNLMVEVEPSFNVTFEEVNLPPATNWSVTLGGVVQSSKTGVISFGESNGTYSYTVGPVPEYTGNPSHESVTVNGTSQTILVTFNRTYSVTFTERGLPKGTLWNVTIGAEMIRSNTSTIVFTEPNGTYSFQVGIVPGWKTTDSESVQVAGSAAFVTCMFAPVKYVITFKERWLPSGTNWSVTVGATTLSSTLSYINFHLTNGSYSFSVANVANYSRTPASGTFAVAGSESTILVKFSIVRYVVTFKENGLSSGTNWSVTVGVTTLSSTLSYINFHLPNGSYSYSVANVANYSRSLTTGIFSVAGTGIKISERFALVKYVVTFKENGLPSGTNWSVTVGLTTLWSALAYINFHLTNGSYSYSVTNVANYSRTPDAGIFAVAGSGLTVTIHFTLAKYIVTFTESGLPPDTSWKVAIGSTTFSTIGTSISFNLANGTDGYNAGGPGSGHAASPGKVTVNGATIRVTVIFAD
jgi:outer membrane protein assembly factor BamB